MANVAATPSAPSDPNSHPLAPPQHSYGTRIRSNSVMRPSARLRQSPELHAPRRIRPLPPIKAKADQTPSEATPDNLPPFPPPNVMLHPEDASSKVFMAIGRSFMSVNNCAMTVKDLAEMTLKFGLICQNASAAGQAITTYIRNHLNRCEIQQDHPLLLRHVLSGTPSDDELVSALHSRVGGAHCTLNSSDNRVTNFRRGTMVWYLSKAAGAPCPFTRAGIRLCEYGEDGKVGAQPNSAREKKREQDRIKRAEQCGQKRKRLRRACADRSQNSDSSEDEQAQRPPKVKLTLRLRPQVGAAQPSQQPVDSASPSHADVIDISNDLDSDDDSMSVESSEDHGNKSEDDEPWSLPPYPRRSISIPCYTPSVDDSYFHFSVPASYVVSSGYQRSPSVPFTSPSPSPESEDEDNDFHVSMAQSDVTTTTVRNDSPKEDLDEHNWFPDHDGDAETQWAESPGPRSPSVQLDNEEVMVKEELRDVRGLLDAWEDFDITAMDRKVVDVVVKAAAGLNAGIQSDVEETDLWNWNEFDDGDFNFDQQPVDIVIKQEEEDMTVCLDPSEVVESPSSLATSPLSTLSNESTSCSPAVGTILDHRRPSILWHDAELLGPDSVEPHDLEDSCWHEDTCRRSVEPDSVGRPIVCQLSPNTSQTTLADQVGDHKEDSTATLPSDRRVPFAVTSTSNQTVADDNAPSYPPPLPQSIREDICLDFDNEDAPVVVHTCSPCMPAICATELEGISVYQMTLGSHMVLRRIDTDFVNVTPIVNFLGVNHPSHSAIPNAVEVTHGSSLVCGTWAPVSSVRDVIRDQPLLGVFLSDQLNERFPSALQDFYRANAHGRSLNQYGPHFRSTIEAKRESLSSFRIELPPRDPTTSWEKGSLSPWDVEDHLLSVHLPFALAATLRPPTDSPESTLEVQTPLSPTEEEMFRALCLDPDAEPSPPAPLPPREVVHEDPPKLKEPACQERSLRRSKRVANAVAITRSRSKRGSRSSLS
ncbi:hypothetical protein ABKN59_003829 [Abortiporus biennis]